MIGKKLKTESKSPTVTISRSPNDQSSPLRGFSSTEHYPNSSIDEHGSSTVFKQKVHIRQSVERSSFSGAPFKIQSNVSPEACLSFPKKVDYKPATPFVAQHWPPERFA
jgi:hypothetical protein